MIQDKQSNGIESSANWVLDKDELENLFNEKTKMIIINNPNNPLGKVFSRYDYLLLLISLMPNLILTSM